NQQILLNDMVIQTVDQFRDFAENKSIDLRLEENAQVTVEFDPTLMEILISNLIKNAIVHNVADGEVRIVVGNEGMRICNTSAHPRLSNQVFERFYKDPGSDKGTGLGLAIVHAICQLYHWELKYDYSGRHCFRINFK